MTIPLTQRMSGALIAVNAFVAEHGRMPSARELAEKIDTGKGNAQRIVNCMVERGHLVRVGSGTRSSIAFGGGVLIGVPANVAAQLASFARCTGESVSSIVSDAITLHIDALLERVEE